MGRPRGQPQVHASALERFVGEFQSLEAGVATAMIGFF